MEKEGLGLETEPRNFGRWKLVTLEKARRALFTRVLFQSCGFR